MMWGAKHGWLGCGPRRRMGGTVILVGEAPLPALARVQACACVQALLTYSLLRNGGRRHGWRLVPQLAAPFMFVLISGVELLCSSMTALEAHCCRRAPIMP